MKKVHSVNLIMKSLRSLDSQENTIEKVYSIILNTKKKQGKEAGEQKATELMKIVDSCKTETELLQKLDQMR